jgi:hypothetical protein
MFSKKRVRLSVFAAVVVVGGLFAYVAPADNVERVRFDDRAGIEGTVTMRPWGEDLSEGAVDAGGIERDLDGNASALVPSDRLLGGV